MSETPKPPTEDEQFASLAPDLQAIISALPLTVRYQSIQQALKDPASLRRAAARSKGGSA